MGIVRKLFILWLILSFVVWFFTASFVALGVSISALSTIIIWLIRKPLSSLLHKIKINPKWKFVIIASLGALWVETEFWIIHKIFNVNIVAHTNLMIDYFFTMPWYIAMIYLFWKVQTKYKFSLFQILLLGGLYSYWAEGLSKAIIGAVPFSQILLFTITFPANILSYSFIVFPASILLQKEINARNRKTGKVKYIYTLLPFVGILILIPVILIASLFV